MSEKKNIVIKVKYPTSGEGIGKPFVTPGATSEWDFKKIGLALGGLLLSLMAFFYFTGNDAPAPNVPGQSATNQAGNRASALEQAANNSNNHAAIASESVTRSQLTTDINKNEPVDTIPLPLKIGKKETRWIYYFVELKGLSGKTVYHEWWLNGNLVSRKKVNISDDPWRTASKQLITYTKNSDWIVRVVDESRNKLVEKSFNLELK